MLGNLLDRGIVGNDKSFPPPLLAQHIVDEPTVGGGGDIIHDIKRGHERASSSLGCCLVGREELVVHTDMAHIDGVIVAPRLCSAIEGIMLHAGHHVLRTIVPLIAAHHRLGNPAAEEGILATALGDTTPAGIEGDIHHRAVGPADTVGSRLLRSDTSPLLYGLQVPAARLRQRNGEHGLIAMHHVHTDNQWDGQSALQSGILQVSDVFIPLHVKNSPHFALSNLLKSWTVFLDTCCNRSRRHQVQLAEFLFDGHLRHQVADELVFRLCHRCE